MLNKKIYFLLGAPCSGKTTIGNLLVNKYNMHYFSGDSKRFDFYKFANDVDHPYMTKNANDFFDWSLNEMIEWERGIIVEQTPFIIEVLDKLSGVYEYVLFEGMLDLKALKKEVDRNRIVYLTVDKEISYRAFYEREDHQGLLNNILNTKDISKDEKQRRINIRRQACIEAFNRDVSAWDIKQFVRTSEIQANDMLYVVEKHFQLINS